MRILFRIEDSCRAALQVWRRGLSANPVDQRALAQVYLEELRKRLVEYAAFPRGCRAETGTAPPRFWVELSGNARVCYTVIEAAFSFGFNRSRTVALLDCQPHPPLGTIPMSLPG